MPELSSYVEPLDYKQIRDAFTAELHEATAGHQTSLPFIRNELPPAALVMAGQKFQVFVLGGTKGEVATVRYNADGGVAITDYQLHPELTKFKTTNDLLEFISTQTAKDTTAIGINFAVALLPVTGPQGQLDGILIEGDTKGHGFQGLQQEKVGATIEHHFRTVHDRDVIVSVANDTVCLLAALATRDANRQNLAAGIVGTGYNMAFFLDDHTIINAQASDFTGFTPTTSGVLVDQASSNVGEQLYNKEIAGGQLFKHYNALVQKLDTVGVQSTEELAALALADAGAGGIAARALFRRSASLVASHFAGFYNYKQRPAELTCIMQGGLFWHGPNYKEMVVEELISLGVPKGAITFMQLEDSDILGAAKLLTAGL